MPPRNPAGRKATHEETRRHNSLLVLRTIYDDGPMSRADVARATGLTRPTVSDLAAELHQNSLIEQVGPGGTSLGRRPALLRFVDDARLIVAVDVAEDELRGALVDMRGEPRVHAARPTRRLSALRILDTLHELIAELAAASGREILGIGIAVPGVVDPEEGVVRRVAHLEWRDLPLRHVLERSHGLATRVINDSHAGALAVHMFGIGVHDEDLLVVNAGRGLGAGIIISGRLFAGVGGRAGEIGHTNALTEAERLECVCGRIGCLETISSSGGLLRRLRSDARERRTRSLAAFSRRPEELDLEAVGRMLDDGDEVVAAQVTESGQALGAALATLIAMLDIGRVVITGSMTRLGDAWLQPLRSTALDSLHPAFAAQSRIDVAAEDQDQILRGAAADLLARELSLYPIVRSSRAVGGERLRPPEPATFDGDAAATGSRAQEVAMDQR